MAIDIETKKKLAEDWQNAFPHLSLYSRNKLYKVVGPIVIGLELIKLPYDDEYRPHFVAYPLWEKNLKECFDYPFILQEFHNDKNLQYNIPYKEAGKTLLGDVVEKINIQSPIKFNGDVSIHFLLHRLNQYAEKAPMLSNKNTLSFGHFLEAKMKIALYVNNEVANEILTKIKNHRWDGDHFKVFNIDVETWLAELSEEAKNPESFFQKIQMNKAERKISKLKSSGIMI
ncbi:hypothetical protein [Pedobacter sp. KLB.chiD]|uniref:hypothetical protein n=1 Tax=Pedobacter sp. KLB.chiD TaxID=3387402 RepID=UPI00399BB146